MHELKLSADDDDVDFDDEMKESHFWRKGSATFVCPGSTLAPSLQAVSRRAGWSPGVALGIYLHCESATDQNVGRMAVGLPVNDLGFAALSPGFKNGADKGDIDQRRGKFMAGRTTAMNQTLLASPIFHFSYLDSISAPKHTLRFNPLFTDKSVRALAALLVCDTSASQPFEITRMRPKESTAVRWQHAQMEASIGHSLAPRNAKAENSEVHADEASKGGWHWCPEASVFSKLPENYMLPSFGVLAALDLCD
ncbi:hypothetical protein FVE85_7731 [Porphyridium purpureum]|uniref:Uncharacterized protein n=1 Tax=Porphyridium purpureum TaxID=35688 RepID=A0A5J4YKA0_PORPP|nr:hypothetical protein FVE85_7731 [Porphyridium purpureum]|eukprot:POR2011..scf210_14